MITTIGLLAFWSCSSKRLPDGPKLPLHFFVAESVKRMDSVPCDFSRVLDRGEMFRIWHQALQPCSIGNGWTQPSGGGITAFAMRSTVDVFSERRDYDLLVMTVKAVPHRNPKRRQTMRVFLNGHQLEKRVISADWTTIAIDIPKGRLRPRSNTVSFAFSYHVSTNVRGRKGKKDPRRYAANLKRLALAKSEGKRLSEHALKALLASPVRVENRPDQILDRESGRFRVKEPGWLVLPLSAPTLTGELEMELSGPAGLETSRAVRSARVVDLGSGDTWNAPLSEWQSHRNGVSARCTVPSARCTGGPCALILQVFPEPAGAVLEISPPVELTAGAAEPGQAGTVEVPAERPANLPDIVLIILDAARSDRFSCYGNQRVTTPNIDRLARDSVVFSNAFALAPYTLCSLPTMVSGQSFLAHGVDQRGKVLAAKKTTFAEQLRDAGYRTICFSTNPNNSRTSGTAQGYDEFYALWTEKEGRDALSPQYITERALENIADWQDPRPVHLQLHYMPPHAPYDPANEFDIFADPDYEGPCDGSHNTLTALESGRLDPGDGCLEQLIAKYDGGLLAADHWVGEVLDALRRRPRWKDTVVLVTADHGDAFLEHGRTGHNSTVFDEMLHVPFILYLPDTFDRRHIASDRLVTLEDIAPTLLATAALRPSGGVTGINLIGSPDDDQPERRYFIARTVGRSPTYALRSSRYKVILPPSGHGQLFDLVEDPGELSNLSFRRQPLFAALGQLLTWDLNIGAATQPHAPIAELPAKDIEMLEAIGYIE